MKRPEIFKSYHEMRTGRGEPDPSESNKHPEDRSLVDIQTAFDTYITSLPQMVRAFPRHNTDIATLEAHYWDRLRYFYAYRDADMAVKSEAEAKFLNEAVKQMEDWFYDGGWTECLKAPKESDIKKMFAERGASFLKNIRAVSDPKDHPNLGRDGRKDKQRGVPNLYDELQAGARPKQVYDEHAFKFFHNPASALNTMTKIDPNDFNIQADESRFRNFVAAVSAYSKELVKSWYGEEKNPQTQIINDSEEFMMADPPYIRRETQFKRKMFFFKTSMAAAEMIRRTGEGKLKKKDFEKVMQRLVENRGIQRDRIKAGDPRAAGRSDRYLDFEFSSDPRFSHASVLHVNADEFPFAFFAVDYLRQQHSKKKK